MPIGFSNEFKDESFTKERTNSHPEVFARVHVSKFVLSSSVNAKRAFAWPIFASSNKLRFRPSPCKITVRSSESAASSAFFLFNSINLQCTLFNLFSSSFFATVKPTLPPPTIMNLLPFLITFPKISRVLILSSRVVNI